MPRKHVSFKMTHVIIICALLSLASAAGIAAGFNLDWFTQDSGGSQSSGGDFAVQGSIAQPDAGVMTGGNYTLTGGFWAEPIAPRTMTRNWVLYE